jgi:hypothetical protein
LEVVEQVIKILLEQMEVQEEDVVLSKLLVLDQELELKEMQVVLETLLNQVFINEEAAVAAELEQSEELLRHQLKE